MPFQDAVRKIWYFLWEEENIWSWLLNVILAFVIIKFLLYPGLGWVLGTPAPIVAVVSGSMEHEGNFAAFWEKTSCCDSACTNQLVQGTYYESQNISREEFQTFSFLNGFNKGDIMILYTPENSNKGDVIVYLVPSRLDPIIHRVIAKKDGSFSTKGDHNCEMGFFEQQIPEESVIGKAIWRIPYLGWIKIIAVELWNAIVR